MDTATGIMDRVYREPWRPLLTGHLAARAWTAIEAIAVDPRMQPSAAPGQASGDASLAGGSAGQALFFAYLSRCRDGGADAEVAMAHLDAALDALEQTALPPWLFEGFTGIAWVYAHLAGSLFDADDVDALEAIDAALVELLSRVPWDDDYDLISGLVGYGVYALEQPSVATRRALLDRVIARLQESAEWRPGLATWFTPRSRLGPPQQALSPDGFYNLGVAHGVPGVIALLGLAAAADADPRVDSLLADATAWLRQQQLSAAAAAFPHWVEPAGRSAASRLAWCYGDPGIAATWLVAARCTGRHDWEQEAIAVAGRAARRSVESSGVEDAGLCHGAAGVAHLFNRLFQATGDDRLGEAARQWFERALDMARPDGVGGVLTRDVQDGESLWVPDAGMLTGAAGVGLALLGACTDVEPEWDRALLLDVPAPGPVKKSQALSRPALDPAGS